jgi:methylenetetrahydrofolate dehydrogenase (NADP+)/methenyltetrahydrofolate cyclohydrolase
MGAIVHHILLTETTTTEELVTEIQKYNQDASIHGIIIQLPLPPHCVVHTVLNAVDPKKDVDGMTGENIRLLYENKSMYIPATSLGILTLLEHYRIACAGKHVVIVGRSSLVGKPTALALLNNDATVTIAHSKTQDLKTITRTADILISATGSAKFINSNHLKAGAIVIDVGITVTDDGHVVGDVDLHDAQEKVSAISPVPGGVGPMTIISLFENLYKAYETNRK